MMPNRVFDYWHSWQVYLVEGPYNDNGPKYLSDLIMKQEGTIHKTNLIILELVLIPYFMYQRQTQLLMETDHSPKQHQHYGMNYLQILGKYKYMIPLRQNAHNEMKQILGLNSLCLHSSICFEQSQTILERFDHKFIFSEFFCKPCRQVYFSSFYCGEVRVYKSPFILVLDQN